MTRVPLRKTCVKPAAVLATLFLAVLLIPSPWAFAHEGSDHGDEKKAAAQTITAAPRLTLQSELYQLVGVLKDNRLRLFLDRTADNSPVTTAELSLSVSGKDYPAKASADGTYLVNLSSLSHAKHEVIATITGGAADDLLIGALDLSADHHDAPARTRDPLVISLSSWPVLGFTAAIFFAGIIFGLLLRGQRKSASVAAVFVIAAMIDPGFAHEGHDHGDDKKAATSAALTGDVPRRIGDGSLFVPKPTQRLLEIRTSILKSSTVRPATRLIGRVIADPNRSGLVQSVNGGRIHTVMGGLPKLGQTVRQGEVLAEIEPPITTGDYSDLAERTGQIDQQVALVEAKISRFERLVATNTVAQVQLDDAKVELDGLQRRKSAIRTSQREREVLRAPASGVIISAKAVSGQVAEARDVLFHIIDPSAFWVEALAFDLHHSGGITNAHAVLENGTSFRLTFQGKGRALQQHATVLQFKVEGGPDLSIGAPVTVLAEKDVSVTGKILPRTALVRGQNGEDIVFEHTEPEEFTQRLVRAEQVDGDTIVITAGVADNARIVVRGADLLNQVR